MKRRFIYFLMAAAALAAAVFGVTGVVAARRMAKNAGEAATDEMRTKVHRSRLPAMGWYPSDPGRLASLIDSLLKEDATTKAETPAGRAMAVISPHAGYRYSGATAAAAYRPLADRPRPPTRVIILGPSHRVSFQGASIGEYDFYETPLGRVPVDRRAVDALRACPLVHDIARAHRSEHSVDIQVPLLQRALDGVDFSIVPIVVGQVRSKDIDALAKALEGVLDADTVVVASSDFTHYGADYGHQPFPVDDETRDNIERLDMGAVELALKKDRRAFMKYVHRTGATICGRNAIAVALSLLPDDAEGVLLKYALSGDLENDYSRSVSYVSAAFVSESGQWPNPPKKGKTTMSENKNTGSEAEFELTDEEKQTLLRLARDTVEKYVREGDTPRADSGEYKVTEALAVPCGAFVTLHENGRLRGCIGDIFGRKPLADCVIENAVNAAARDPRFMPVKPAELDKLDIEISVLTPLKKVDSYDDIEIGRHGVLLRKGGARAVFLPQVAPEQGWDIAQTLSHLSMKAGLAPNAWKDPDMGFEVFEAIVFGEKE